MPDYDFHQLSPIDFEDLVRNLLQADLGVRFESFPPGKDGGIDARYSKNLEGHTKIIIQCKHYLNSSWSNLKRDAGKEKKKVDRINPERYIFATSQSLTPPNKDELLSIFQPHIKDTGDILGKKDINDLLEIHPRIEQSCEKLWAPSRNIQERITKSELFTQKNLLLNDIERIRKIYVETEHYQQALEQLNEFNCCVITGAPGMGKTTLAKMLVDEFINQGYELVVCSSDIREAYSLQNAEIPQVFYYDDFLGQTSYTQLGKNEAQRISSFLKGGCRSKDVFILTSRDYILTRGIQENEQLSNAQFDISSYRIQIETFSEEQKALILYNHLYYADLDVKYINQFISASAYNDVIWSNNFSPRIIEELTSNGFLVTNDIRPDEYVYTFLNYLKNPELIWDTTFNKHLNYQQQIILFSLLVLESDVMFQELYDFIIEFCKDSNISKNSFEMDIEFLKGTFIKITGENLGGFINFRNPSIKDFLQYQLVNDENLLLQLISLMPTWKIENLFNFPLRSLVEHNKNIQKAILDKTWGEFVPFNLNSINQILSLDNYHEDGTHFADDKFIKILLMAIKNNLDEFISELLFFDEAAYEIIENLFILEKLPDSTKMIKKIAKKLPIFTNPSKLMWADPYETVHYFYLQISIIRCFPKFFQRKLKYLQQEFQKLLDLIFQEYESVNSSTFNYSSSPNLDELEYCGGWLNVDEDKLFYRVEELMFSFDLPEDKFSANPMQRKELSKSGFTADELFSTLIE